jgi:broad specificity phosphatase PhoE
VGDARHLLLVRHSLTLQDPDVPSPSWRLSAEGRRRCEPLAATIAPFEPELFVCSTEPKARETAELAAAILDRPVQTVDGLQEHERPNVPLMEQGRFQSLIEDLFARPDDIVFGAESATTALERFSRAINGLLVQHPQGALAVVTHATVLSLFVASTTGRNPHDVWTRLGMPALCVFSLPGLDLVKLIEEIDVEEPSP